MTGSACYSLHFDDDVFVGKTAEIDWGLNGAYGAWRRYEVSRMFLAIDEPSQIGHARRHATSLAVKADCSADIISRLQLVVTEMATNILKHARSGAIVATSHRRAGRSFIEIIAFDSGPGIPDVTLAFREGYSTSGTLGGGLAIMKRQADALEVFSTPSHGTVIAARFDVVAPPPAPLAVAGISEPVAGEEICGDNWDLVEVPEGAILFVADGLGHGAPAAEASERARDVFRQDPLRPVGELFQNLHKHLSNTRGAVASICRIDARHRTIRYAGIGNITANIVAPGGLKNLIAREGIIGGLAPAAREVEWSYDDGARLVLHTDGLSARWTYKTYPEMASLAPSILAGLLFRDFRRIRDDATIVAVQLGPPAA